jgi:hypothetical protein
MNATVVASLAGDRQHDEPVLETQKARVRGLL